MTNSLIDYPDYEAIRNALAANPLLANGGIPYDDKNIIRAHPLHRICDRVFSKQYSDAEGVEIAKIFLEYGADIEGNQTQEGKDTPLLAASSLHADLVALLYITKGANINHAGLHGGTPLHWAAWCGRDIVVKKLISEKAAINRRCVDFKSTPLFWAIHGYKFGGLVNQYHQVECARLLIEAGADKNIPNAQGKTVFDLLDETDTELKQVLAL